MTSSNLMSLPVDIPWKRLGTSKDMMDPKAGDRKYPPKWRSSLAVFFYEPTEDEQKFDDRIITYIKVSCTITGLQNEGSYDNEGNLVEVHMQPKDLLPLWKWKPWQNFNQTVRAYYPCYGAMLQVAVFPGDTQEPLPPIEKYPYILDFEPKKREMYESSTEGSQILSQSRSGINTKKGTTDLEYSEFGTEAWAKYGSEKTAGVGAKLSYKKGTRHETVDQTTADYSREKRENYSYTTNLSHMYTLLNSYHLGTNRVVSLVLPRPHIMDSEYTFVNGPRKLEGIQEFFLVVERPKDIPHICVEATLETAHLEMDTVFWPRIIPRSDLYVSSNLQKTTLALGLNEDDKNEHAKWLEEIVYGRWDDLGNYTLKTGYDAIFHLKRKNKNKIQICLRRGWNDLALDERAKLIEAYKKGDLSSAFPDYDQIILMPGIGKSNDRRCWYLDDTGNWIRESPGHLMGLITAVLGNNENVGVQNAEIIFETIHKKSGDLFLTGRTTTNCTTSSALHIAKDKQDFLTWQNKIGIPEQMDNPAGTNLSHVAAANQLVEIIGNEMIESLSSPDRLPYGEVGLEEASFVQEPIREALNQMPNDDSYNLSLDQIEGLDREIRLRLDTLFDAKTRKEALSIELYQLCSGLGLTKVEAMRLRTQLIGNGPSLEVEPGGIIVPNVEGMSLEEAQKILDRTRLVISDKVTYKDALEPLDTVLNQFPNPGTTVKKEEAISLIVSSGPVAVPDVTGLNVNEATAILEEFSLRVETSLVASDKRSESHVLETAPFANTEVPRNSHVVLMITKDERTE